MMSIGCKLRCWIFLLFVSCLCCRQMTIFHPAAAYVIQVPKANQKLSSIHSMSLYDRSTVFQQPVLTTKLYSTKPRNRKSTISTSISSTPRHSIDGKNVVYGIMWITIVLLAFTNNHIVPSGAVVEATDTRILNNIVENPAHPRDLNELYLLIFNIFAIVPILISCLLLPVEEVITSYEATASVGSDDTTDLSLVEKMQQQLMKPQPYVIASSAIGYFAMGIYLSFRRATIPSVRSMVSTIVSKNDVATKLKNRTAIKTTNKTGAIETSSTVEQFSWFTKNIWENSILHWSTISFLLYLPFGCNVFTVINDVGWNALYNDFIQLLQSSRFCATSCIDLFLLHITCVSLIPADYMIRSELVDRMNPDRAPSSTVATSDNILVAQSTIRANQIAFAAALVPYLGSALYIALRPSMILDNKQT